MSVATFLQPNYPSQSSSVAYPLAIDAAVAVVAERAAQFAVNELNPPVMKVAVRAGRLMTSAGALVEQAAQETGIITAPVTNPRNDLVVIDSTTAAVSVVTGAESATPTDPAIPAGKIPLARIRLATSTMQIPNSLIDDLRPGEREPEVPQAFPSGTKMLFQQTAAPTGWTKDTTHDNKALRVVTGAASSGGADAFTTVFGTGKSTNSHTLTTTEIPAHNHTGTALSSGAHTHDVTVTDGSGGSTTRIQTVQSVGSINLADVAVSDGAHTHTLSINNTGSGGGHSHGISNLNLAFVDIIIATKD